MKHTLQLIVFVLAISIIPSAHATLFQLKDNPAVEAVDEAASFSLTIGGITATLTANIGVLNTTTGGFGVNAPAAGDTTDEIDAVNGIESVTVTFNKAATLEQIVLSNFTGGATGDLATLTINSFPSQTLIPTAPALDVYNFTSNNFVPLGQSIILTYQAGNGFSFDSFSVVPEPASLLLLGAGLLGLPIFRKFRR